MGSADKGVAGEAHTEKIYVITAKGGVNLMVS
jgi:hypothetical protein